MWITPRSLDLSLAYEVGNLRDPRVGNIMTLDIKETLKNDAE
jgi:hypothetical protein